MASKEISQKSYFELTQHNSVQVSVFLMLSAVSVCLVFILILPLIQGFFEGFLHGRIFNHGEYVSYTIDNPTPVQRTSYLLSWAIDIYAGTPDQTRYWFNPFLSVFLQSCIIGLMIAVTLSSIMPQSLGYMRQKIERELINEIDKIALGRNGSHDESEYREIMNEIYGSDLRHLRRLAEEWCVPLEDLKTISRALKWKNSGLLYRMIHLNDGIRMYMRFYFTVKYSNTVLGFVYMGAAVLIIIIGLRGLKFIPPTQPSLVLFALGLEFCLLITYAVTIMYARQDEENDGREIQVKQAEPGYLGNEFGSSREIEKLLRVFIKSEKKK